MSNTYAHKAMWHTQNHFREWMKTKLHYTLNFCWYRNHQDEIRDLGKIRLKGVKYITEDFLWHNWYGRHCNKPSGWDNKMHDRPMRRRVKRDIIKYLRNPGYEPVFDIFGKPYVYYD